MKFGVQRLVSVLRLHALCDGSIRSRLILSFSSVALLSALSALIALFLLQTSERQTRQILNETLPTAADAQALGRTIGLYAAVSKELPAVEDEQRHEQLIQTMRQSIDDMEKRLDAIRSRDQSSGPDQQMEAMVDGLRLTMERQHELVLSFLAANRRLKEVDLQFRTQHRQFADLVEPRMKASYRNFIEESQSIRAEISSLITQPSARQNPKQLEHLFRVGFESLVGAAIGEAWASHELTAVASAAFSILLEAEMADSVEKVAGLKDEYDRLQPVFDQLELVVEPVSSRHDAVLQAALGLYRLGQGDSSPFALRTTELTARGESKRLSEEAEVLSLSLAEQARLVTDNLRRKAAVDSEALQGMLATASFVQLLLVIFVVLVSVAIGWYYVGRHLVSRVIALKKAMDQHAMGIEAEIPLQGKDEITDMAYALQCFVRQRSTVETALRQSIDSLNEAQLIAKLGSCTWDEDGAEWQWSDGFYRMLGYQPGEIEADREQFLLLVDPADQAKVERFFRKLSPSVRISELDFSLCRKDGSRCIVTTRWRYAKVGGKITGSLHGTLLDITERQRIEEELLKIKKLESIGVLAGGIAHDFNNLLTVIMGNTALARRELPQTHVVQHFLRLSENAANRARDLTSRLLTFAKGGEPIRSVTDMRSLLNEVVEFVLHGSKVRCVFDIPEDLWSADVDAGQIGQVIQNLAVNAIQAMPEGGEITVTCHNVHVDGEKGEPLLPGDYLRIEMIDQGHGIAEEHLKRVFDPYFTTREMDSTKGSGLGLAIVHSIIRKHGGTVDVSSTVGQGTTFTLHLPALPGAHVGMDSPGLAEHAENSPRRAGLVLVMDDEQMVRDVVEAMLQHLGFEVLSAVDGEQAIAVYRDCLDEGRRPDLVIMDLTIPGGMGGERAAQALLDLDPTAKIIVASGYSSNQVLEQYRDHGFCAIASKPFQIQELSETISTVLALDGSVSTR